MKNVELYQENIIDFEKAITEVAHKNKNINHGILFDFKDGARAYISGLNKLSWGMVHKEWFDFESRYIEDISFIEFSNENTYRLIDKNNMKNAIELIVKEIIEKQKSSYQI